MYNQTQINSFLLCLETNVLYLYQELIKAMSFVAGVVEVRVQLGRQGLVPGSESSSICLMFPYPILSLESTSTMLCQCCGGAQYVCVMWPTQGQYCAVLCLTD